MSGKVDARIPVVEFKTIELCIRGIDDVKDSISSAAGNICKRMHDVW